MDHIPSGDDKVSKTASVTLSFLKKKLIKSNKFT